MAFLRLAMVSINVVFLVILLSNQQPSALAAPAPAPAPSSQTEWILTLQWPYTGCNGRPACPRSKFRKEFTILGLWTYSVPLQCKDPNPYNPLLLKPIKARLEKDWLNVVNSRDNNKLWKRQYETDGMCQRFGNTRLYFDKGLEAYDTLNRVGGFLVAQFAGKAVPEELIYEKLKSQLQNKDFAMICRQTRRRSELEQIRLYFKYQEGTGVRGWTLDNMPFIQLQRCSPGNISLPLV